MNVDEIIKLMQAVSDNGLTSLELKEGELKLSLKREKEMPQIVTVSAPSPDAAAMQMAAMQTEVMQMAYRKRRASMQTATALRMVRTVTAIYRLVNVVSTGSPLYGSL